MPMKISEPRLPHGLARLAFRLPILFYSAGLGNLLGTRFVRLTHTGRKSGRPRQSVLEVVHYDPKTGGCIVASGWGEKSDWFRNVSADPHISFQMGRTTRKGVARRLSAEEGGRAILDYAHRHPFAMRELAHFMGYRLNGTDEDYYALGAILPMFEFSPVE